MLKSVLRMKYCFLFVFLCVFIISGAQRLIPYHGMNCWGYADMTGRIVIPPNKKLVVMPTWPYGNRLRDNFYFSVYTFQANASFYRSKYFLNPNPSKLRHIIPYRSNFNHNIFQ